MNDVRCSNSVLDKYATIEKCNSLNRSKSNQTLNERATIKKYDWLRKFSYKNQKSARHLIKSKSDAAANNSNNQIMQHTANKSVNRNGTIARNQFRGVPGEFLAKQTRHFLLSMTVSIIFFFSTIFFLH